MEYHAGDEPVAQLLPHPGQVPSVMAGDGTARLYFEREDAFPGELGDDVDFVSPVGVTKVV